MSNGEAPTPATTRPTLTTSTAESALPGLYDAALRNLLDLGLFGLRYGRTGSASCRACRPAWPGRRCAAIRTVARCWT